jgi:hypothetical protein
VVAYALGDRSLPEVPAAVGSDSAEVSAGARLHGFLGGLGGGDPRGAAHSGGKRDGRNGPHGALEQDAAPTTSSFCPHDVIVFQVGDHARGLFASLALSLQYRAGYPAHVSHYLLPFLHLHHPFPSTDNVEADLTSAMYLIHSIGCVLLANSLHAVVSAISRRSIRLKNDNIVWSLYCSGLAAP